VVAATTTQWEKGKLIEGACSLHDPYLHPELYLHPWQN